MTFQGTAYDPEILPLLERAFDERKKNQVLVFFYDKHGILMKRRCPLDVSAEDEWTVNHKIVVSRIYRTELLNLAHATPMPGHLGIHNAYHKIRNHFYWPGLKSDVSQFCKSCHTCQMVGKTTRQLQKLIYSLYLLSMNLLTQKVLTVLIPCPKPKKKR